MTTLLDRIKSSGIISSIGQFAPAIASALGSPIAGMALALVAGAFGVKADPESVTQAMNTDPDTVIKLKNLENAHAEELANIAARNYALQLNDIQDAREKGVAYIGFLKSMAYLVTIGFFGAMGVLLLPVSIDPSERQLLSMLIGMLVSKWQTIIDFYFGSSTTQGAS